MVRIRVGIYREGVREIAKSETMQALIKDLAEEVAQNVREQDIKVGSFKGGDGEMDLPVEVTSRVTDRARSAVTIAHPAGLAVQAKHGALTRAAAEAGLKVKGTE